MVIVEVNSGLGDQFHKYATGRCIAHKLNTELKMDLRKTEILDESQAKFHTHYRLGDFNIQENFATPEEIERVEKHGLILKGTTNEVTPPPLPDFENFHGDVFVKDNWMHDPKYYEDIADILRKEFTLKNPSQCALAWQEKILAAECAVSLHFRHGDKLYNPQLKKERYAGIPSLDYYYTCMDILKREFKNMTAFVFSDDIQWCKENLRLDIPIEFVSGSGTSDNEEFFLISLCKHNIGAPSTFSWHAAFLNANPAKKCFRPNPSNAEDTRKTLDWIKANKISPSNLATWVHVPYDFDNQPEINTRPYFSLLMVVNNDVDTLEDTLDSILAQDYKYFELIIIDNASFDDSANLCKQAAKISDKITLIKLYDKISDGAAWNKALNIAQGKYVMFLKGGDRIFPDALTSVYPHIEIGIADVIGSAAWLCEDDRGTIEVADRKFSVKNADLKLSAGNERAVPIATKLFYRKFLSDNAIKFDEKISDADAELKFITEAMLGTEDEMLFLPEIFYIAPKI